MAVLIHWKADFLSQITKGLSKVEEIGKIEENKKFQIGQMQSKSERGFLSTAVAANCDNADEVKKHKKKISKELKKQQHAEEDGQTEKNPVEKENVSEQFRERSHSLPERAKCRLSPKQFFKQGRLYHQKIAGMFLSEGSATTSSQVDVDDIIDTLAVKFDDTVRLRVGDSCHLKGKKVTENGKNIAKIGDTGADEDESGGCVLLARGPIGMHMERNVYTTPYPYAERRVARQSYSQVCNYPYSPPVDYTQDAFIQEPPQQNLNDLVYLIKSPCPSNNNNNNNNLVPQVDDSVRHIAQYEQSWLPPPAIDQYCLEPSTFLAPAKQDLLSINIGQRQQQSQLDYNAQNLVGFPSRLTQMVDESPFSDYGDSPLQSTESSGCGSNLDGYCIEETIKRTPPVDEEKQLPEGLSDFILKYSRQYQSQSQSQQSGNGSKDWLPSNEPTPKFTIDYELSPGTSNTVGLSSSPDSVDSPGAAIIVRQRQRSAVDEQQPQQHLQQNLQHRPSPASSGIVDWCSTSTPESARDANSVGGPRHRLRELITETELDKAWAWALKYEMTSPGKLYQRDVDGDSYLHIAVWNQNLARIYALTEVMMKTKDPILPAPFDLPNASNETPLYLAVQKQLTMVAAYFVDCGADVNVIANNSDGGTPLHYAVAHGMSEMVEVLASSDKIDLNIKNNSGLTPLLIAVKTDGSILDDQSQTTVQNRRIIRFLLQHNADPFCQDMNGKTIIHYCVEKLDADLLEFLCENMNSEVVSKLVNVTQSDGMSPLEQLSFEPLTSLARCEKNCIELSDQILLTLIKNGAEGGATV
ncbi:NF-kappa-B inhibitor zeta [Trichinella zimbabwensis]|uniref:NF-kappa-B inhibitor zeta n=1 Tax=Trichinella zimbabwensis TaxID=268475 RepID=A0A0V1HVV5_9BILA|nr:NF-kappa-B inhibitor zeta [Trichinella zimbabwensis]